MFRRLLLSYVLLTTACAIGLALTAGLLPLSRQTLLIVRATLAVFALVQLLGVVLVSWRLSFVLTRSLGDLSLAVGRVEAGADDVRVFPIGQDELSALGAQFNRMSERLTARITRLEGDHQLLRAILSGMVEGVVALDAEQRVLFVNERGRELLGLPATEVVGRRLWEAVRHRPLIDAVRRALAAAAPCQAELQWTGPTPRCLMAHAARLPGEPPRGAVLVLHDITELRRLERLRQDFVANVSHELKTPLSVIKVCAETLLDGAVEDAANRGRFLEQIGRQADRLHALILDLLSLARLEAGEELFDLGPLALDVVAHGCVERHRPRAEARQQTLAVEGPPLSVWADEEAVDHILENLLDNALKYTPEGGTIRVCWRAEGGQALIEVSDTGIGIPATDLPRVFERFYRVDRARSRELGGTGLGLSIVKHLAQALRGGITARSQPGQGTTFTVRLPLAPAEN